MFPYSFGGPFIADTFKDRAGVTLLAGNLLGARTSVALLLGAATALLLTFLFYRYQRWRYMTFEPALSWQRAE